MRNQHYKKLIHTKRFSIERGDLTYKGERETVRDLRPVSRPPRSPISMDFFFPPCSDEVVTDKLRLDDPPWLAIFYCWDLRRIQNLLESSTVRRIDLISSQEKDKLVESKVLPGEFVGSTMCGADEVGISSVGDDSFSIVREKDDGKRETTTPPQTGK